MAPKWFSINILFCSMFGDNIAMILSFDQHGSLALFDGFSMEMVNVELLIPCYSTTFTFLVIVPLVSYCREI